MKKVLITGASSGIGLTTAIYLVHQGFEVVGTSRNPEKLDMEKMKEFFMQDHSKFKYKNQDTPEEKLIKVENTLLAPKSIVQNLSSLIEKIKFIKMDVLSDESVSTAISEVLKRGPIDVLMNNAGGGLYGSIETMSMEQTIRQYDLNLFGAIRVIKAVLPSMRERKQGQIINISSLAAIFPIPFSSHYCGSKAALKMVSEALAIEVKPFNIKVSTLSPGDINTNFNSNMAIGVDETKEEFIESDKISIILDQIPEKKESPYYKNSAKTWTEIIKNLIISPPPMFVAKKVYKIINAKRPKIHYYTANLQQRSEAILSRFLSGNLKVNIAAKFFGIE